MEIDRQLAIICALTAVINVIGVLALAARIAGVRTGRIALSFALFNVLVLVSRISNSFFAPFLAKRVELNLHRSTDVLITDFRIMLASAGLATIAGCLLIPTVQRLFGLGIERFDRERSMLALGHEGIRALLWPSCWRLPRLPRLRDRHGWRRPRGLPFRIIVMNVAAQALLTVGVPASLYAGYLYPEFRATAAQLSSVVNGVATLLLFLLIDPQLSAYTDDVVRGRRSQGEFRRAVRWLALSRVAGAWAAQLLLLPAAWIIVLVARHV